MSQTNKYVYTTRWKYRLIGGVCIALAVTLLCVCLSMTSLVNRILFSPICLVAIVFLWFMTKKLSDDAAYYLIDAEGLMFRNRYIEPQYRDKSGQKFLWTNIKSITIEEIYVIKSASSPNVVSSRYAFTSQFGLPAEVSFVDGSGFVLPIPVEILSTFVSQCNDFAGHEVCRITKLN